MPVISILCYSAYQFFVRSYNTLKTKQINVNFFFICEVYNTNLRGLQYHFIHLFARFTILFTRNILFSRIFILSLQRN